MSDEPELKPCPFCGATAYRRAAEYPPDPVSCTACTAQCDDPDDWNKRAAAVPSDVPDEPEVHFEAMAHARYLGDFGALMRASFELARLGWFAVSPCCVDPSLKRRDAAVFWFGVMVLTRDCGKESEFENAGSKLGELGWIVSRMEDA